MIGSTTWDAHYYVVRPFFIDLKLMWFICSSTIQPSV